MTDFKFKHVPLAHQMEDWLRSRDLPAFALLHEMGCGKSKIVVDTAGWLYLTNKIDTVVIVSRKGVYANWHRTEIPEHMSDDVPYVSCVYRSGLKQHEKDAIKAAAATHDKLRVLSVNVEGLKIEGRKMTSESGKVAAGFIKSSRKGVLFVVDESTVVKSYKAVRSKAVYALASACAYRRILTGTPVPRSPLDLWGQCLVLGPGLLGARTFTEFRSNYARIEMVQFGARSFPQIKGYKNLDRLQERVTEFGSIRERADCVDLPPKIFSKVAVDMTDEQHRLYSEMKDLAVAELGGGEIVEATNALSVISRLDQLACGQIKRPDGTFKILDSDRPEALVARLDVDSRRAIVWCSYRGLCDHLFGVLRDELGLSAVGRYYGGVSDDERSRVVREMQEKDAELRVIVANQSSMGYGWTLTAATDNHYYSNGYNLEHRLQSEDRTMRIGQDEAVNYTDYFSPGTVNEKIFVNLRNKRNLASLVLGTRITDWI